jgi:polar amino acid transport system substrate-binding protein
MVSYRAFGGARERHAMRWCHLILIASLAGLAPMSSGAAPLRISHSDDTNDAVLVTSKEVVQRAYALVGEPVEFVGIPLRRSLAMLLAGQVDGNLHRTAELAAEQPSLVRVATPLNVMQVRAYSIKPGMAAESWAQLSELRVAYRRGILAIERNLPVNTRRIEANSSADLFRMLAMGIADVALLGEPAQSEPNPLAEPVHANRVASVLHEELLYHYVLAKHGALAERLNTTLLAMQASGETRKIRQQAMQRFDERVRAAVMANGAKK